MWSLKATLCDPKGDCPLRVVLNLSLVAKSVLRGPDSGLLPIPCVSKGGLPVAWCHSCGPACEPPLFAWHRQTKPVLLPPFEDLSAGPLEALAALAKAVQVVMTAAGTAT